MPSIGRCLNSISAVGSRMAIGSDSADIGMLEFNFTEPDPEVQATHVLDCGGGNVVGKWTRQGDRAAAGTEDGMTCFFAVADDAKLVAGLRATPSSTSEVWADSCLPLPAGRVGIAV
eukprot:scaffold261360_cov45-Prasinocladus_malaysianus.AAC.1